MLLNLLAGGVFAGFVMTGVAVLAARGADARRARVRLFLAYSVAVSFAAGLGQRDLWPFSAWPLVAGVLPRAVTHPRLLAVDAKGGEHAIDYRAWQPLGFDELVSWIEAEFPRLAPADRDTVAAYLLGQAEQARRRARSGGAVGELDRFLGPLSAPYFLLHPRLWDEPAGAPAEPFVRLRLYRERWDLLERQRGVAAPVRALVFEYPRP
jgi:hypothetical protein